jgi:hypothetical protein
MKTYDVRDKPLTQPLHKKICQISQIKRRRLLMGSDTPFPPQYPIINGSQITWFEIDSATSAANIATGVMATWFPNNQLAPMPDLAVSGDQYGVCGEYGASVCAPSFAVLRAGDYVYIQVRNV